MAEQEGGSSGVARSSTSTTTIKLPSLFRRTTTVGTSEKQQERLGRSFSVPEVERRSSLPTLPIRMRRRKTQPIVEETEQIVEAARLGRLLFSIPSEIFVQILTNLNVPDIRNLRLTSQAFSEVVNANASAVTRNCMHDFFPEIASSYVQTILYPVPTPCPDLSHFLRMIRRQTVVDAQIYPLLSFLQMKIYMARTGTRILSVNDNRQRLIEAFQRPCWTVNHFLEHYRQIIVHEHPLHHSTDDDNNNNNNNNNENHNNRTILPQKPTLCPKCTSSARRVISQYPRRDVMPAYHFYQLLLEHLQIAMRAPSSTGPLERRLRGWSKASTMEENLAGFLILGGMPEVSKVAMMQGSYSSRLQVVVDFVHRLREAVTVNTILEGARHGNGRDNTTIKSVSDVGVGVVQVDSDRESLPSATATSLPSSSSTTTTVKEIPVGTSDLFSSLSPPFQYITQETTASLPDLDLFFFEIWEGRIRETSPSPQDVRSPYPWLQRVMSGSGVDFRDSGPRATSDPPLMLGASPV